MKGPAKLLYEELAEKKELVQRPDIVTQTD
jgi:hypothetical protein